MDPRVGEGSFRVPTVVPLQDVTERAVIEGQLLQSHKMEAVGRLAGGIAHDLNNLLTAILGNCELLSGELLTESARTAVREIELTADMAATLVDQLLEFSRRRLLRETKIFDLSQLIGSMKPVLRRVVRDDIRFEARLNSDDARVKADRGQMERVILNLAINASDAMPSGGTLTVETSTVGDITASAGMGDERLLPSGDYVLLKVSDTGVGMDPSTRQRIFEPFFTTKEREPGRGTGLGLAIVYGIVTRSNGKIFVDSEPGRGTTFRIYLPREKSAATEEGGRAADAVRPADPAVNSAEVLDRARARS
jgi:signal transduction histidine kinase